jgi:hypothetical protein
MRCPSADVKALLQTFEDGGKCTRRRMHRAEGLTFVSLCDWRSGVARTTCGVIVGARLADAHCQRKTIAMEPTMRTLVVGLLSLGLVAVSADASAAASKKSRRSYESYAQRHSSATPRQLYNAWAYNHAGQYYETDSNAFPVGSRGWWEMKRLEGGGRVR